MPIDVAYKFRVGFHVKSRVGTQSFQELLSCLGALPEKFLLHRDFQQNEKL
jgi:hypothetical protein